MRPDRRRLRPPSQCPPTLPQAEPASGWSDTSSVVLGFLPQLATAATSTHMMSINERMKSVEPKISLVHKKAQYGSKSFTTQLITVKR